MHFVRRTDKMGLKGCGSMKRKLLSVILIIFIVFLLPLPVLAHPGRTDANGGHYNRSTGEYHYHHGYSAHQHYDMDGDGTPDCPYDFNDDTGSNSRSTTIRFQTADEWIASQKEYDGGYDSGYDVGYEIGYDKGYANGYEDGDQYGFDNGYTDGLEEGAKGKVPSWIVFLTAAIAAVLAFMLMANKKSLDDAENRLEGIRKKLYNSEQQEMVLTEKMRNAEDEYRNDLESHKKEAREKIRLAEEEALNIKKKYDTDVLGVARRSAEEINKAKDLADKYKKQNDSLMDFLGMDRHDVSGKDNPENKRIVPLGISFADDGLPILGKQSTEKYYGDYTVFVCEKGSVYHENRLCGNGYSRPTHLFKVIGIRRPCSKCCSGNQPPEIPQWYRELRAKRGNLKY